MKKKPSQTRVVGYTFNGDIDISAADRILRRAAAAGVVTQFDHTKSGERGLDCVWFNGPPGKKLRTVRDAVASFVNKVEASP